MNALLFIDMLGVRSRWHRDGRAGAERAFHQFNEIMELELSKVSSRCIITGGIESDSAAIVFSTLRPATNAARRIFQKAFTITGSDSGSRMWLRGVITSVADESELFTSNDLSSLVPQVQRRQYSNALLDAIAIEKSGIKRTRILIGGDCLGGKHLRKHGPNIKHSKDEEFFIPAFKRLAGLGYPTRIRGTYRDFLWMADPDETVWEQRKYTMFNRLILAAAAHEEFMHAAATQTVFNECSVLFAGVRSRNPNSLTDGDKDT